MFVEGIFGDLLTRALNNLERTASHDVMGHIELALVLVMFISMTFISWKALKQWKTPETKRDC